MATTWIKPIHRAKGQSLAHTLDERTDYAENHEKTRGGELVMGYGCDPRTAGEEFYLAKTEYERNTGRSQGKRDIIAYHIRQAFKPGEIAPQEALEVGNELAMRFTKGKHAFIVGVHTDRAHVHCHIIFNSTALDCTRKFRNFWDSSFALRRLSDLVCAEHGLSVVENPAPSKGQDYRKYGGEKKPTWGDVVKRQIDELLPSCRTFEGFVSAMKAAGYEIRDNRKHISVRAPGQKKPSRMDTLGGDYTEAAIRARLGMAKTVAGGGGRRLPLPTAAPQ